MAEKKRNLEDVENDIKSLSTKRDKLIVEANKCQEEILKSLEEYNNLHPDFIKVICVKCNGVGYLSKDSGTGKRVCDACGGKCYLWMKRYSEVKK